MSLNRRLFMKVAGFAAAMPKTAVETVKSPFTAHAGKILAAAEAVHGPKGGPVEQFAFDQLIEQSGLTASHWAFEEMENEYYKSYHSSMKMDYQQIESLKSMSPMVKALYKQNIEKDSKRQHQIDKIAYHMIRSARERVKSKRNNNK